MTRTRTRGVAGVRVPAWRGTARLHPELIHARYTDTLHTDREYWYARTRGERERDEGRGAATLPWLLRLLVVPPVQGALRRRRSEGTARLASNGAGGLPRVQDG